MGFISTSPSGSASRTLAAGLAATFGICAEQALAQQQPDLVVSEVHFAAPNLGDTQWIEIANHGTSTRNLGNWSIYMETRTAFQPQTYWFGMPPTASIGPGEFIRIHWFSPVPAGGSPPGEVHTGDTLFHFLFSRGAEPLQPQAGAIALFDTKDSSLMSDPTRMRDYMAWGATGLQRETVAAQAGLWNAGSFIAAPIGGASLALNENLLAGSARHTAWFPSMLSTPRALNAGPAELFLYETACTGPNYQQSAPALRPISSPVVGNPEFALAVDHTTAGTGSAVLFLFSTNAITSASPFPVLLGDCNIWLEPTTFFGQLLVSSQNGTTILPFDLSATSPTEIGARFHVQAAVLTFGGDPEAYALTGGLAMTVGG